MWDRDFSYKYFLELTDILMKGYALVQMRDVYERSRGQPRAIMRHDVDVCPQKALRMAELEAESGVKASYFIMTNSPLYSISAPSSQSAIKSLQRLGHEVALHFDAGAHQPSEDAQPEQMISQILAEANIIEDIVGGPIHSVSFHRPCPTFLGGASHIDRLVNAYGSELMKWYLSDSRCSWRENPAAAIEEHRHDLLQILIHPVWWGPAHMSGGARLEALFQERVAGKPQHYGAELDRAFVECIGLERGFT